MTQQHIDVGDPSIPGSGESLADAFPKVEANFGELYAHAADKTNPHGVTKVQVGLGAVNNTSDADKPVSNATQTALTALGSTLGGQISGKLSRAANLGDLADRVEARGNLGLAAIASDGTFDTLGGTLKASQVPAFTGDVTATTGSFDLTIKAEVVTNAKLAKIPAGRIKGNPTGAPAAAQDASISAFLDLISSAQGALLLRGATTWTGLSSGSVGTVLTVTSTGPAWVSPTNAPLTASGSPTTGQLAVFSGPSAIQGVDTLPAANAPAFTGGDVTSTAGSLALTIAAGAVTFAKLAAAAVASVTELFGNTASKLVSVAALWSAQVPTALTDSATIAVNMNAGVNFSVTLSGNRTLGAPTNAKRGQSGVIEITQDGTGSRTLSYASAWDFGAAGTPTLSTAAGKTDVISYYVLNTTGPVIRAYFGKSA